MDFKIGNTRIENGLVLAPMAGITDISFRTICREFGASLTVSEMISAKGVYYNDKKTAALAASDKSEGAYSIQIFGSDPDIMLYSALKLSEITPNVKFIDINMGCPMPKITGNGDGSALMKDPMLAGRIVSVLATKCGLPVTVKMRTGWDKDNINAPYLAGICEQNGASMICVHGRTRDQLYRPPVDYNTISEVKKTVNIPVVANGGIYSAEDALKMLETTKCDGIAIAQGAMGNPWIFKEVACALNGKSYSLPEREEILSLAFEHVKSLCKDKGEYIGVREARKHLGWYIKGMPGAADARAKINQAETIETLANILIKLANIDIL